MAAVIYSGRIDLAQKVEAKQLTPEDAEFQFRKLVAQVNDEKQKRLAATAAANQATLNDFGQRLQNAGRALQSIGK